MAVQKDEIKDKVDILDALSEMYDHALLGEPSEKDQLVLEKSSEIINNANLPSITGEASDKIIVEVYAHLSDYIHAEITRRRRKQIATYVASIAAVLTAIWVVSQVAFSVLGLGRQSPLVATTIAMGDGQIKEVQLVDGTKINMNQDTRIYYYKSNYNDKKREIWMSGEASFDVAKDPKRPFIIHSGDFTIKVLGTAFNVKSYPNLRQYTVSVRRGRVNVHKGDRYLGSLVANKELAYDTRANTFTISDKDCNDVDKWTSGSLVLNNADANELVFRMRQYYGVELKVGGKALSGVMINGIYDKTDTPENVIKSICLLYNINYSCHDGIITVLPR